MKITEIYPKGGKNRIWEPSHLVIEGLDLHGITIEGRTWGRDGAEISILYNGEELSNHNYDYHRSLGYQNQMARDVLEDVGIIFEMIGLSVEEIFIDDLVTIMDQVRTKCESRFGNLLPNSDYEVLVIFN